MNTPLDSPPPPPDPPGTLPDPLRLLAPKPSAQAEATFFAALDRAPEDREVFIAGACAADETLLEEVRGLLALYRQAGDFMDDSPGSSALEAEKERGTQQKEGERIGRYKLLQEIGEGGFGTVWMAEQMEPVSRRVALKIIKLGMDTREVIARFEAERQALAMMDDPNIAKVFDAGATDTGRPFFVMELVKGIPITQYCDEAGLGTRERLALFGDVCSAIHHAHQKGVIHRDIKPSNVMVTLHGEKPVVKIIDFGIAKATEGKLTDKTLFTRFEQFIGTPAYMSPEQAAMSGLDVDTRSDIYALGVLLYELLTGKPPFDARTLASAGYDEMRRIIREVEPPRPSWRLSTMAGGERASVARARRVEPEKLRHLVASDLDWIVMKAIDKDRSRRYETANSLALDVERFLADKTVSATPPSAGYRFRKFARRNKAVLRVAAGITAVLLASTIVSSLLAVRATRAEKRAKESELTAHSEATRANEQKLLAEENLSKTQKAEQEAMAQSIRADGEAEGARRNLYFAQMHLALQAWREHRGLKRMRELLSGWLPKDGASDRRGWEWFYVSSLPYQNLRTVTAAGSGKGPGVVAWHIGSKRLAEGTAEGVIRIWDVDAERMALMLRVTAPAWQYWGGQWLAWSPDGGKLAAASSDGTVHLWETVAGRELTVLRGHTAPIVSVAFSTDSRRVAAWAVNGAIKIWDIATGRITNEVAHPGGVCAGAWSPDGKLLASGQHDGTLTISGIEAGDEPVGWRAHADWLYALAWSPDSTRLASTSASDFFVSVWDVASRTKVLGPLRHSHGITSIAWEPDGKRLATGSFDQTVKIWDGSSGQETVTLRGHENVITSVAWGPGDRLASGSSDGSMRIWDSLGDQESKLLSGHTARATSVAWSPDGRRLASGGDDGRIRIWDPVTRTEIIVIDAHDPREIIPQFGLIGSLSWSPDGKHLASAGFDGTAKIWEVASGRELYTLPAGHGVVWCLAWSADGRHLAVGSQDGTIGILKDPMHLPSARFFKAHDNSNPDTAKRQGVRSLAWNSQGDRLASSGWDTLVKIWDPSRGAELVRMEAHKGWVLGVAWSPSGKELASAGSDTLVRVLNAATGKKLQTMRGHSDFVDAVVWSPDGTRLASAGLDNSVRIWDPQTGEEAFSLRGNSGMFHDITWHPDGTRIAAASSDGQIWIWDATRGFERDTTSRALPYINRQRTTGTVRSEDLYSFLESYVRAGKFQEALALAKDDPASLRKLARLFQESGDTTMADAARAKALALLEMQFLAEPHNETIVLALADLVLDFRVTPDQESKRAAAIEMADPWGRLASAYYLVGEQPALDRLLQRRPAAAIGIGELYARLRDWPPAIAHFEKCVAEQPDNGAAKAKLINAYIYARRWDDAIVLFSAVSAENPGDTLGTLRLAALLVWFQKHAEYAAVIDRTVAWAKTATSPVDLERVAKLICLRANDDVSLREVALAFAKNAVELGKSGPAPAWYPMSLGMAEYRCGNYLEADKAMLAAVQLAPAEPPIISSWIEGIAGFYRAMVLVQQHRLAEARALFTATVFEMKPLPADEQNPLADGATHDDLILWMTCKEAKALLTEHGAFEK